MDDYFSKPVLVKELVAIQKKYSGFVGKLPKIWSLIKALQASRRRSS